MTMPNGETVDSIPNWAGLKHLPCGEPIYLGRAWRANVLKAARRQRRPTSSLALFNQELIVAMGRPTGCQCALLYGDSPLVLTADDLYLAPTIRADLATLRQDLSRVRGRADKHRLARTIEVGDRLLLALHQLADLNGVPLP